MDAPETREVFDLRVDYLPAGDPYNAYGEVWWYSETMLHGVPVMECRDLHGDYIGVKDRLLSDGKWERAEVVYERQFGTGTVS